MEKEQLKKEYREMLLASRELRTKIGLDIDYCEETIRVWAKNINPKLTRNNFISSFRKQAGIGKEIILTESVPISLPHERTE